MFIHDLEFIDSCEQEYQANGSAIRGGATAIAGVSTSATDGEVSAGAYAEASGDLSRAQTVTGATVINRGASRSSDGYIAGYGTGYGVAYGVDRYSDVSSTVVSSTSTI